MYYVITHKMIGGEVGELDEITVSCLAEIEELCIWLKQGTDDVYPTAIGCPPQCPSTHWTKTTPLQHTT